MKILSRSIAISDVIDEHGRLAALGCNEQFRGSRNDAEVQIGMIEEPHIHE